MWQRELFFAEGGQGLVVVDIVLEKDLVFYYIIVKIDTWLV
jgi:hypothetical protein